MARSARSGLRLAGGQANNEGDEVDSNRIDRLVEAFGNRPADIPIEDLRNWFAEQECKPETFNRYTTLSR